MRSQYFKKLWKITLAFLFYHYLYPWFVCLCHTIWCLFIYRLVLFSSSFYLNAIEFRTQTFPRFKIHPPNHLIFLSRSNHFAFYYFSEDILWKDVKIYEKVYFLFLLLFHINGNKLCVCCALCYFLFNILFFLCRSLNKFEVPKGQHYVLFVSGSPFL